MIVFINKNSRRRLNYIRRCLEEKFDTTFSSNDALYIVINDIYHKMNPSIQQQDPEGKDNNGKVGFFFDEKVGNNDGR